MLDVLSDVLTRLSVQGTLYFRTSFTPPFGVEVPAFEDVARFHYAHHGTCYVAVAGSRDAIHLDQGDLLIVPHGARHCLLSQDVPHGDALSLDTVIARAGYDGRGVLIYDGGAPEATETQLICGHFSFAPGGRHLIFERLPPYLHIRRYGDTAGAWLSETLQMIGAETEGSLPGGDLIALRLSETILAHAIRVHLSEDALSGGPLAGFADSQLLRVLSALHADPSRAWTIALMAKEAGMSRSAFAARFAKKLGVTPMEYLKRWRMQIARDALASRGATVAAAAAEVGYTSEAAFSRAFKAETGLPPSALRKSESSG